MLVMMILALLQDPKPPAPPPAPPPDLTRDQIIQQDIKTAIDKLSGDDYWEAALARNELLNLGKPALKPLIEAFHASAAEGEKNVRVRYWVCEILGDVRDGSDDTLTILTRSLNDGANFGSVRVHTAAAISLSKIGSEKAIDPLIKALEGPLAKKDESFKAELIVALGILRAKQAEALIRDAFKTDDHNTFEEDYEAQRARVVSAVAAEALGKIRAKDSVGDLVRRIDAKVKDPLTGDFLEKFIIQALQRIQPDLAAKSEKDVKTWAQEQKTLIEKAERAKDAAEKKIKTLDTMKKIQEAVAKYKAAKGSNPATLESLKPDFWKESDPMVDGWDRKFSYNATGTGGADYDLVSYADDGLPGGTDINEDLWNHDKWTEEYKKRNTELLKKVADAVVKFKADNGRYPFSLIDLTTQTPSAKNWPKDGYLPGMKDPILDVWGGQLKFLSPGKDKPFDLTSLGRDQKDGGEGLDADVTIWSLGYAVPDEKK